MINFVVAARRVMQRPLLCLSTDRNRYMAIPTTSSASSEGENEVLRRSESPPNDPSSGTPANETERLVVQDPNPPWTPSGKWYMDMLHFVGPGWFVSIAYIDPGNYQADIQAGATSRYALLFIVWWTSILSVYVQILCVRLAYRSNLTLAQAQAHHASSKEMRYLNWAIAEFSTVITDLPEVIGIGIACNIFFGWPYYVGVLLSLLTTMTFLATMNYGTRILEMIIFGFVGIMSISLLLEMDFVQPNTRELIQGWVYGFRDVGSQDVFAITGVVGAVVMPHNLHLHTASCQLRPVQKQHVGEAVWWSSLEPVVPILVSFFINLSVVAVAAETVFGLPGAAEVGLSDFCAYFQKLKYGCVLWGIALLAAGQSSAITTTFTGQYVMDGFLNIRLPIRWRAVLTRLVAITPCVVVSAAFPDHMNHMVNIVNSSLSFLLPFAFTPLVKYNCSPEFMGEAYASRGREKIILYCFAGAVWFINAVALSIPGGGFFGDLRATMDDRSVGFLGVVLAEFSIQLFYLWWNIHTFRSPVAPRNIGANGRLEISSPSQGDMENSDTHERSGLILT